MQIIHAIYILHRIKYIIMPLTFPYFLRFTRTIKTSSFLLLTSLLQYLNEKLLLTSAPGRGVAAEEFCVFGDWGGSLNKPEKPERSGGFFANGAPYALLATFVERAIWRATCIACQICLSKKSSRFVRQNAPACHITLIERFSFIEKSSLGFWTF